MSYFDKDVGQDQLRILFENMREDGQIADVVFTDGRRIFTFTKPPVLAWSVMCSDKIAPDMGFLAYSYAYLKRNLSWWETERFDGCLFSYKVHKMESGWDDTVRFDDPNPIDDCYAIDCNCFMIDFYRSMAYIAERLGEIEDISAYDQKRVALAENINTYLWNEKEKWYCDYNFQRKEHTNVLSPASFMPLFCGIADAQKAEAMKKLAENKEMFYPGIPTVSYNHSQCRTDAYWRGPTWLNMAYFTIRGLYDYGYESLAFDLLENILDWCSKNKDSIYEYYDSKTGKGLGAKDFGWSCAFIIELVLLKHKEHII
jgi:neutral trehalase